jgi:hypothetical protein
LFRSTLNIAVAHLVLLAPLYLIRSTQAWSCRDGSSHTPFQPKPFPIGKELLKSSPNSLCIQQVIADDSPAQILRKGTARSPSREKAEINRQRGYLSAFSAVQFGRILQKRASLRISEERNPAGVRYGAVQSPSGKSLSSEVGDLDHPSREICSMILSLRMLNLLYKFVSLRQLDSLPRCHYHANRRDQTSTNCRRQF